MTANRIVYLASVAVAIVAVYKFLEHPTSRNLRTAIIDVLGI